MDVEVPDLISQMHMKLSAQLEPRVWDLESATYCSLFLPRENAIGTEMQDAGQSIPRQCGKVSTRGMRKLAHLFLHDGAEGHRRDPEAKDRGTCSPRRSGIDQEDSRELDGARTG